MSTETGVEAILGRMTDEHFPAVMVNRIRTLLGAEEIGGDPEKLVALDKGKVQAIYNRLTPGAERGLGAGTFKALDRFRIILKQSKLDVKTAAREAANLQEARAAEKERLRAELYGREVEFDALTSAMAALGTLKLTKCSLGRLMDMYDLAKGAS